MSAYVSKYSWRNGYNYGVSAAVVGNALKSIEKQDGEVTAKSFLEYSRPEESETHSMFEWDDTVAAEKYRLSQSGKIINQLAIELVYKEDESPVDVSVSSEETPRKQIVSAYLNILPRSVKASASFVNSIDALNDSGKRRMVLANAKAELSTFKRKYSTLAECADIIAAIERFEKSV